MADEYLKRYTDIPALIYLLSKRSITLLDPKSWDDSNDSHYLALYKDKYKLKTLLALCFTNAGETYHHWRVFADGSSGVCIRLKRDELIQAVKKQNGLRTGRIRYLTLNEIRKKEIKSKDLPFIKRYAFENEAEFRIIYESKTDHKSVLDIAIPLSCIERVTLSPWIHKQLVPDLKKLIHAIEGCRSITVVRSSLIGNEEWKRLGEAAR